MTEQFVIAYDGGWIFRKAWCYRGALQEEDKGADARKLLAKLAEDPSWAARRYLPLHTAVQMLGHGEETKSIAEVRRPADRQSGFERLVPVPA